MWQVGEIEGREVDRQIRCPFYPPPVASGLMSNSGKKGGWRHRLVQLSVTQHGEGLGKEFSVCFSISVLRHVRTRHCRDTYRR